MTVTEAADKLAGTLLAGAGVAQAREVRGGYVSDLLSDVIGNAEQGCLWVTIQRHVNIVAVAHLKGLAGIVLVGGRQPEPGAKERAEQEGIPIIGTELGAWDAVGTLYRAGVMGRRDQ